MLILAAVAREPGHGYAILQRVNSQGSEVFDLPEGTVYPLLHKLDHEGLISGKWRETDSGRQIKVYSITPKGKRALNRQRSDWDRLVSAVGSLLSFAARAVTA